LCDRVGLNFLKRKTVVDEIDKRLRETADRCIKAYEGWAKAKREVNGREELMEAVHELRKVASRVEIELAVSDRDEASQRAIPIPPHRAQRPRTSGDVSGFSEQENAGNDESGGRGGGDQPRRRPPFRGPRPAASDDNAGNS
jgi:hypothetical protein